jgi:hypothetical protein
MEIWRDVEGYIGAHQVSDEGRIRSLARLTPLDTLLGTRRQKAILKPSPHAKTGHLEVSLSKDGQSRRQGVHLMVLTAFIGPKPEGHEASFADGDKRNNRLDNLSWSLRAEHYALKKLLGQRNKRVKNGQSDLTEYHIREIRRSPLTNRQQAILFGVSNVTISNIKRRRTWAHIT